MNDKHYVIQWKKYPWDDKHWEVVSGQFKTYEEAEARRLRMPDPNQHRVAESYIVVRYKAVKK